VTGDAIEVLYEMDSDDLAGLLRAVRLGAQHSDLLIVSAHIHQEGPEPTTPPAFASELAHAAVDAGADVFVSHGVHRLWPIEIYRERPIFYGLGNFVFSDIAEPLQEGLYRSARRRLADPNTENLTDADVTATLNVGFENDTFYESVIADVGHDGEGLHVAVHPIDLGMNRSLTQRGIPHLADPERSSSILKHLAEMSEPFGTKISADGSVTA
jgi:poly-gamma-glutamate synthesis protein (capsule biosynthesis protein)